MNLKIIAQKDNTYNFEEFLRNAINEEYLDGLYFDIVQTQDGKIIVFNTVLNNEATIKNIQESNYSTLLQSKVVTLERLLSSLNNIWKKKVILNLIPLITPAINDQNIKMINSKNEAYVDRVVSITNQFLNMDLRMSTESVAILYFLRQKVKVRKLGIILNPQSLGYIDVDFYIVKPLMFDVKILEEQLRLGKEVIFQLDNVYDINYMITNRISKNFNGTEEQIAYLFEHIYFMSPYPELIYRSFQVKS